MPIVFEPFVYEPINNGIGSGSIRALGSKSSDVADFGIAIIRPLRTRTTTRGSYKQSNDGTGSASLVTPFGYGFESGDTFGVAIVQGVMSSFGTDTALDELQNGVGLAYLDAPFTTYSAAFENVQVAAVNKIRPLYAYGQEPIGDYGITALPRLSSNTNTYIAPISYMALAQAPGYISAFAGPVIIDLADSGVVADSHILDFVYGIVDRAFSLDSLLSASRTASLLDSGSFQDRVQRVLEVATTDGLTLTDDVVDNVIKIVALIDAVRLSDNNIPWRAAAAAVADTLTALSVAVSVADGDITDAATVAEALDARRLAMLHLVDAVSVDAAALGLGVISLTLDDSLDIAGDVLTHTTFIAALTESLNVAVSLTLDGIPYVGFCMNTSLKAVTEFGAYDFNSLAHLRGRMYGARDDGLYLLEGPDDAGAAINASLRTALTRIAGGKQAHVDSAYLGYSSDGQVQIKVITTEATGSKTSRVYQLNPQIAVTNRAGRIKIGKGVKSAYWAFEITNVLGEDFTIDVLELHVLALSRRV